MARARVRVGNPVRMAQAARMSSGQEIVDKIGSAAVEPKLDGFRVQIHRDGDQVRIYSRNLEDMSLMFPDVSAAARALLKKPQVIIEGEAMGVNPETGAFLPFQVTTSRRRRHGIDQAAKEIPLQVHAFDLLYDGDNVIELPFTERRQRLEAIVAEGTDLRVSECITTDDPEEIDAFFAEQVNAGLEGVMAKRLDSVYQAGQRNFNWIKYKASYSSAPLRHPGLRPHRLLARPGQTHALGHRRPAQRRLGRRRAGLQVHRPHRHRLFGRGVGAHSGTAERNRHRRTSRQCPLRCSARRLGEPRNSG